VVFTSVLFGRLLNTVARHFDNVASRTLRNVDVDKLPLLLIVTRNRATNEVRSLDHGRSRSLSQ